MTAGNRFNCAQCNALYQVVKVEAGPETVDHEITCRACSGPLTGRDGKFVLKYFLLRKAARLQKWKRGRIDRNEKVETGPPLSLTAK